MKISKEKLNGICEKSCIWRGSTWQGNHSLTNNKFIFFVEFMFGERIGEIRMLCQEDVYAVISLELISYCINKRGVYYAEET